MAQSRSLPLVASRRRFSLLNWLLRVDTAYRHQHSLANLSDAQLRDIGLTRDQIDKMAQKPVWNAPFHWMN